MVLSGWVLLAGLVLLPLTFPRTAGEERQRRGGQMAGEERSASQTEVDILFPPDLV